jgi:large subunit ribosomal protein L10
MSGGAMATTEPDTRPNERKAERVAELKERIDRSDALLLTEYRGLTVSEITELRRSLAEGGTKFAVVKNTLMRRAVNDAGVAELEPMLEGPSAVAFVEGDPVAAAKSVVDAAKKFPTLVLKGGFMDGKLLSAADAKALASLESREVMLSKIAGLIKSEMSKAAAMFVGAQSKFLGVLEAYKDKLPAEDVVEAAAPAPEDAPAAEVPSEDAPAVEEAPTEDAPAAEEAPAAEAGDQPDQANDDTTEAEASGSEEEE